jgi:hypothetical protein
MYDHIINNLFWSLKYLNVLPFGDSVFNFHKTHKIDIFYSKFRKSTVFSLLILHMFQENSIDARYLRN